MSVALKTDQRTANSDASSNVRKPLPEIALVGTCALLYSLMCAIAPVTRVTAVRHARQILRLENYLGIDVELALNTWLSHHPWLANVSAVFYSVSFFAVTFTALAIVWVKRPDRYDFVRNSLFVMTGGAMITYWVYPLAPPRFFPSLGYVDAVATQSTLGSGYSTAFSHLANSYAAMPSMHTGWAVWSAIVLGTFVFKSWRARAILALHPLYTIWVILATANHYVLDAVGGIVFCLLGFLLTTLIITRVSQRQSLEARGV